MNYPKMTYIESLHARSGCLRLEISVFGSAFVAQWVSEVIVYASIYQYHHEAS